MLWRCAVILTQLLPTCKQYATNTLITQLSSSQKEDSVGSIFIKIQPVEAEECAFEVDNVK